MELENRIRLFIELGKILKGLDENELDHVFQRAQAHNNWFTKDNVNEALSGISRYLEEDKLRKWISNYNLKEQSSKTIGVVMAGNIPLAGFHDMLTVLISGNNLLGKLSSQDPFLPVYIAEILYDLEPAMKMRIDFQDRLKNFDAIIATGSDNTARYFNYYFGKHPHIIRQNRNSCAVIYGTESKNDFEQLGKDVFQYFGLGCRNISKLYVPEEYNFNSFFEGVERFNFMRDNHKYNNNYDYNKSIYLVNGVKHFDNGFLLVTQNIGLTSPISVLFYESYKDEQELNEKIILQQQKIQCIVSKDERFPGSINLGKAQEPEVWEYADKIDTMEFLISLY
jgi:hypothetical protein